MRKLQRPKFPFNALNSPAQRQWKRDRAQRQAVPPQEAWRGCLALAALLDPHHRHPRSSAGTWLIPNESIRWLCLRDIPAGHFPQCVANKRRQVNYANGTRATVQRGTPCLNFNQPTSDAWDFHCLPFGSFCRPLGRRGGSELVEAVGDVLHADRFPRTFNVLNLMSAAMTDFAFCGTDECNRPIRPSWFFRRQANSRSFRIGKPEYCVPVPYLAFPFSMTDQMYKLSVAGSADRLAFQCASCQANIEQQQFTQGGMTMFEDGNFVANCPACRTKRKWHLADGNLDQLPPQFPLAFREGFCDTLARGLPLQAIEPMLYYGPMDPEPGIGLDLVAHRFVSAIDDRQIIVHLPHNARMYVFGVDRDPKHANVIPAGATFCRVLDRLPAKSWLNRGLQEQWATRHEACGNQGMVGYLQQLWFDHQALRLPFKPNVIFFPTALAAAARRDIPSVQLWWDFAAVQHYFVAEQSAFVLPPLPLDNWHSLKLCLPGGIDLDAGIPDPRFDPRGATDHGFAAKISPVTSRTSPRPNKLALPAA